MASRASSVNPTTTLGTPPLAHPVIDELTGRISVPWAAWINLLYARVGQGSNNNIQNAQAAAELAAIGADQSGDIAEAEDRIHDELAGLVDTSEGRIAAISDELLDQLSGEVDTSEARMVAIKNQLRDEIASIVEGVSAQAFQDYVSSQFEYENSYSQQINDSIAAIILNLATQVTGVLAIANGGTGQTNATAAFNALVPSQTGNAGKYLTTNGTNTSWGTPSGGGGSFSMTQVTVTVSPVCLYGEYETTVIDAAVNPTDKILTSFDYDGSDDENGLEELDDMKVFAVAGTGQITFTLTHQRGAFAGDFKLNYAVSA